MLRGKNLQMQNIKIHRLGPIKDCEISIQEFMVLTGAQASGKSTLAKSIFFFKNIKNLLLLQIRKRVLMGEDPETKDMSCKNRLIRQIRSNFLQTFGSTWCMDDEMILEYQYTPSRYIKISLTEDEMSPNYIWVEFSLEMTEFLQKLDDYKIESWEEEEKELRKKIDVFFDESMEIVYVPAGRSLITLLSSQLNYIYSSMNDLQKRSVDYCTQNYLERILRLKPEFAFNYTQLIKNQIELTDKKVDRKFLDAVVGLMQEILKGEYINVNGEERLQISDSQYVKINFASSGQQEVVWILNVLFYHLLYNEKAYFIIEEPESHLFPSAQKKVCEFIAAVKNRGNSVLVTTHSPYILGELNNLLYANNIAQRVQSNELLKIVNENKRIDFSKFSAYFLHESVVESCLDDEFRSIKNEIIDGASEDINNEFTDMIHLENKGE